jgi:hypothetical protein
LADVVHHAAKEGGERRHLAGAQEREGVGLNGRGPVGGVRVESVQEVVLDPAGRENLMSAVSLVSALNATYLDTWPSLIKIELICERRSGSRVAAV